MDAQCGLCGLKDKFCTGSDQTPPVFCPTKNTSDALTEALARYSDDDVHDFALDSLRQEHDGYCTDPDDPSVRMPAKPRIAEIIEFCKRMGYRRIGLAFCLGLRREAAVVQRVFSAHGLEVVSVVCKVGAVDKTVIGADEADKLSPGQHESMCNPVAQAFLLNEARTDFNVVLGLCVGHDSLFLKHSDALCTVLAVKDRLLGNNPLAAVYTEPSYYGYLGK